MRKAGPRFIPNKDSIVLLDAMDGVWLPAGEVHAPGAVAKDGLHQGGIGLIIKVISLGMTFISVLE